jgi:hypothetical protein
MSLVLTDWGRYGYGYEYTMSTVMNCTVVAGSGALAGATFSVPFKRSSRYERNAY